MSICLIIYFHVRDLLGTNENTVTEFQKAQKEKSSKFIVWKNQSKIYLSLKNDQCYFEFTKKNEVFEV